MWEFLKANWKLGLVVLAILVLSGFCIARWHRSFEGEAPGFMQQAERRSPSRWFDARIRQTWKAAESLLETARRESKGSGIPLAAVQFLSVRDLRLTVIWETETFVNPGFEPMSRFESVSHGNPTNFIGYYTLDGSPLIVTLKRDPRYSRDQFRTVHLASPLAPGATTMVFRVEQRTAPLGPNRVGQIQLQFWRLGPIATGIRATGVSLPDRAHIDTYYPATGTIVGHDGARTMVFWINSLLDVPVSFPALSFTLPS